MHVPSLLPPSMQIYKLTIIVSVCVKFSYPWQINWPSTNCLPLAIGRTLWQIFLNSSSFILSDLKCYRSAFSSFTNHLWNAKPKDQPKKSSKENMLFFRIAKHVCFNFFSFWPFLLSNLITFLVFIHFKLWNVIGVPPEVLQIIVFELE